MRGVVPATLVAVVALVLSGCTMQFNQQANSPEASATPTTSTESPTPAESPTPETSPSPTTSPSPAKLIITKLPFHIGEVGVAYSAVTVKAKGGVPPYKWSIASGALPPGVVLSTGGIATGKPTTTGTFSFTVRVDDSAGAAAGAPSSILVFRRLMFTLTKATCGNSPSDCAPPNNPALRIPYTGGIPGDKPIVKIVKVTATISLRLVTGGCSPSASTPNPPPGMATSASGGVMTLSAGALPRVGWCNYSGTIIFELVDRSPCGTGLLCTTSNTLSVLFGL